MNFTDLPRSTKRIPKRRKGRPRRGPWRAPRAHGLWLSRHLCCICYPPYPGDVRAESYSQGAHVVNNGSGSKGSDEHRVPLCLAHHDEYDGRVGKRTRRDFERKYGVNMREIAAQYFKQWEKEQHA